MHHYWPPDPPHRIRPEHHYSPVFGANSRMPRGVRAAQVIFFVLAGLSGVSGVTVLIVAHQVNVGLRGPALYLLVLFALVLGSAELAIALRFMSGGRGTRIAAMTWCVLSILGGVSDALRSGEPGGLIGLAVGLVVAGLLSSPDAIFWFRRPRD